MIHLKGHTALITASTGGIGLSIAKAMAEAGANVVLNGRSLNEQAQAALATCRAFGVRASFVAADLLGPTEATVSKLVDDALAAEPDIDILVNNAGGCTCWGPIEKVKVPQFEETFRLNVASGFFLTQRFAQRWIANKTAGRVLFIGSINGRLAELDSCVYDTTKGAIEMMVRSIGIDLARHGIRVNGLAPGLVRTPQTKWIDSRPDDAKWIKHHTPNGDIPHSDVCGDGAVYLCSDAAKHVVGQMLLIDGGMSVWQQPNRMV